jgi:hypothetical protein
MELSKPKTFEPQWEPAWADAIDLLLDSLTPFTPEEMKEADRYWVGWVDALQAVRERIREEA